MVTWLAKWGVKKARDKKVFEFLVPKPKPTKGESTKVWGQKSRGKFKKSLEEASTGIDKALKDTGQLLQKIKKIPITKSGVSKGKDIKK